MLLVELENWAKEKGFISSMHETGKNKPESIGL